MLPNVTEFDTVALPCAVILLAVLKFPKILRLPPIPAPPYTTNAPELKLVEDIFAVRFPTIILPLAYNSPLIPTPPATTNAPVLKLAELGFMVLIVTTLLTLPGCLQ